MNATTEWSDRVPERDGVKSSIYEVAFSPDGTRLIAAVGNRVLLYDAETGNLIDSLRGHKETVTSVDFCGDGTRFASGGADKVVVIWKSSGQGLLKYNHTSPIQRVKFCPVGILLASCAEDDFGLWTPDQKQVQKDKTPAKVLSVCWNPDGSLFAMGLVNGMVLVKNSKAVEICRIDRNSPVWSLCFMIGIINTQPGNKSPSHGGASAPAPQDAELLMVGCWDKTISSYKINKSSAQKTSERNIKFYPTSISVTGGINSKNSFMLVTGANKKCILFSRDIMRLSEIATKESSWIWSCATPLYGTNSSKLAIGCDNGDIDVLNLKFDNVCAVTADRYAYRENLTEIVVQHLVTDRKVRIKCRDLIRKLALYKHKLAVQVSDKVFIYESNYEDLQDIHFRLKKERVTYHIQSENMAVTINYLLFSNKRVLSMYTFDGVKLRSWTFGCDITYLKVDTGVADKEVAIVGMMDGTVFTIFVDNPFPLEIAKRDGTTVNHVATLATGTGRIGTRGEAAVTEPVITNNKLRKGLTCVSLNLSRTMVATVDEQKALVVSNLKSQEVLFRYSGVIHVCFNTEVVDVLCFSTDTSMYVVSGLSLIGSQETLDSYGLGARVGRGNGSGIVRPDDIVPQEQHIGGPAVAVVFTGQRLHCLYHGAMTNLDIPQGNNIASSIEKQDFETAYRLACLGATSADWRLLGMRALRANAVAIAKNCFSRLQDVKLLGFIEGIEAKMGLSFGGNSEPDSRKFGRSHVPSAPVAATPLDLSLVAELLALEGHTMEAAKTYARANRVDESIRLLTELRKWQDAKLFAQSVGNSALVDINDLNMKQAKWLQEINDWKGASEINMTMGHYMQACKIVVDANTESATKPNETKKTESNDWKVYLLDLMRRVPKEQMDAITLCGDAFMSSNEDESARECYVKAGNIAKLMNLYGKKKMWTEAAKLADEHPGEFDSSVFLPYAEHLVAADQYMDAIAMYRKANRRDYGRKVLEELTYNAVVESRFKDAAYYYWLLSRELEATSVEVMSKSAGANDLKKSESSDAGLSLAECQRQQIECEHKADLYYAYSTIHSYMSDPFTVHQSESLFQTCCFIINSLGSASANGEASQSFIPHGISTAATYYTLGRQAMQLGCYKLARHALDRLSKLQLPARKHRDEVELDMLTVHAKPMHDNPDHAPVCFRCGASNPLLNPFTNRYSRGDVCATCGHPFVRSFINFHILPLVEFVPEPSISDEEAIELIRSPASDSTSDGKPAQAKWKDRKDDSGANVMSLDDDEDSRPRGGNPITSGDNDLFNRCLTLTLERQQNRSYVPVVVNANTLLAMNRNEVFVCKPSSTHMRATFYRNMLPDISIAISQPCHRFFHLEDFEFAFLSEQNCPYSRLKNIGEYGSL